MKNIIVITYLIFISACSHVEKQIAAPAANKEAQYLFDQRDSDPLYLVKEGFRRQNADKFAKTSKELMSVLQKAKVPAVGKEFFVYDISCYAVPATKDDAAISSCNYYVKSRDQKKRAKKSFSGAEAEQMRMILSMFPVNQGDSGVSAKYLHCEQTNAEFPSCDLAVELNYAGP